MNSTTLGYSFIDDSEENHASSTNKAVSTSQILNKLKNPKTASETQASKSRPQTQTVERQPVKPKQVITAFSEDDDEIVNTDNSHYNNNNATNANNNYVHRNPLINEQEGFNNYDMGELNKGHYTTEVSPDASSSGLLYDFGRHMSTNIKTNSEYQNLDRTTQEKINYIIHMLEQNRQLRTENITEEMFMYFFLGFFVLYISENFVKMGKYTR